MRVVMRDRLQCGADIAKQLADLIPAARKAPLREEHLGILSEQIKDAAAVRGHTAVVECLQILDCNRLSLFVGHRLGGKRHDRLFLMDWVDKCRWRRDPPAGSHCVFSAEALCVRCAPQDTRTPESDPV
jgi:hypothetical protein